ncbi:MAG TPA: hypothetical protein VFV37_10995 [Luteibaculaceae bacterium]|nr:hypothetical protein [Luteibaculaceae bacterium]
MKDLPIKFNFKGKTIYTNREIAFVTELDPEVTEKRKSLPFDPFESTINYALTGLKQLLDSPPMVDEVQHFECEECGGRGEVDWKYNGFTKQMNCPVCEGDAYHEVKTGKQIPDKYYAIKIKDHAMSAKYLAMLPEDAVMVHQNDTLSIFESKDCRILISHNLTNIYVTL